MVCESLKIIYVWLQRHTSAIVEKIVMVIGRLVIVTGKILMIVVVLALQDSVLWIMIDRIVVIPFFSEVFAVYVVFFLKTFVGMKY